jgi:hypothetical protein
MSNFSMLHFSIIFDFLQDFSFVLCNRGIFVPVEWSLWKEDLCRPTCRFGYNHLDISIFDEQTLVSFSLFTNVHSLLSYRSGIRTSNNLKSKLLWLSPDSYSVPKFQFELTEKILSQILRVLGLLNCNQHFWK